MAKVTVEVVTPERRILSQQVDEAIIPGSEGLFGVRPGHTALLSLLDAGPLTLRDGATTQVFFVAGGFAQVNHDTVMVLADQAEPVAAIDVGAAQKRLAEAQETLKTLSSADAGFSVQSTAVRRETARIALATKRA